MLHFLIFPNCRKGGGFSSYKIPKKSYEWFSFNWRLTSFSRHLFPKRVHQPPFLKQLFPKNNVSEALMNQRFCLYNAVITVLLILINFMTYYYNIYYEDF